MIVDTPNHQSYRAERDRCLQAVSEAVLDAPGSARAWRWAMYNLVAIPLDAKTNTAAVPMRRSKFQSLR